jgi:hypothetical protein
MIILLFTLLIYEKSDGEVVCNSKRGTCNVLYMLREMADDLMLPKRIGPQCVSGFSAATLDTSGLPQLRCSLCVAVVAQPAEYNAPDIFDGKSPTKTSVHEQFNYLTT